MAFKALYYSYSSC